MRVPLLLGLAVAALLGLGRHLNSASAACNPNARIQRMNINAAGVQSNDSAYVSALSADGRYLAFFSNANAFYHNDNGGSNLDMFVYDQVTGRLSVVSKAANGAPGSLQATNGSISADGQWVVYGSWDSTLVPGDTNTMEDVFAAKWAAIPWMLPGENVLTQGSFEDGDLARGNATGNYSMSWSDYLTSAGGYYTPLCLSSCGDGGGTAGPRQGAWWAWFGGFSTDSYGELSQRVRIPPGQAMLTVPLWVGYQAGQSANVTIFSDHGELLSLDKPFTGYTSGYAPITVNLTALAVVVRPAAGGAPVLTQTAQVMTYGSFMVNALPAGSYGYRFKAAGSLAEARTVALAPGMGVFDLGAMRMGDANNDNVVNISDFSILAATFGLSTGEVMADARADFNADTIINITDFSLLASSFGQSGAP